MDQQPEWEKFFSLLKEVMLFDTLEKYNAHLNILTIEFQNYQDVIDYVTETLLNPYKEKFIA